MHIAIDGNALVPPLAGPGKYAHRLITHMLAAEPANEYTVVFSRPLRRSCGFRLRQLQLPHHPQLRPFCRERVDYRLWAWTSYSRMDRRLRADVYHGSGFTPLPTNRHPRVLTVHDVSMYRFPNLIHPRIRQTSRELPASCRAADKILTVSEHVKREIVELLGVPESKIAVTYNGIDAGFRPGTVEEREEARTRFANGRPYLLHVGTLQPRKNIPALIRAHDRLTARAGFEFDLVLAGAWGWKYDEIQRALRETVNGHRIHVLSYVNESELRRLYRGADLLVLPSLYEGFGIPVAEAMASGVPVIASRAGALPEVVGHAGVLIDPTRAEDELLDAIPTVLEDSELRARLIAAGLERARRFDWTETAASTLAVYREVVG
ncbi:MAG TPA: glycosyltransferase family 1 protein [Gemmatimonadaceae bacterium]|nr:glycosyltransferase family 1 protein [Gemmatimonadaceae bacterium]